MKIRTNWLRKLNYPVLRKKTPLLGLTILELMILTAIINGGLSAIYLSTNHTKPLETTDTNINTITDEIDTAKEDKKAQAKEQKTVSEQSPTYNTNSNSDDEWLKAYDKRQKAEDARYAEIERCETANTKAGDKYYVALDRAKAAYDKVMAEWNNVKDLPYYQRHPYEQYANDAKAKYNAISKPAYTTYINTLSTLRAQGCKVVQAYSESVR